MFVVVWTGSKGKIKGRKQERNHLCNRVMASEITINVPLI